MHVVYIDYQFVAIHEGKHHVFLNYLFRRVFVHANMWSRFGEEDDVLQFPGGGLCIMPTVNCKRSFKGRWGVTGDLSYEMVVDGA